LLSAKQIAPGQTGELEVRVATQGLSGNLVKAILVTTNDPRSPEITLSVTAEVEPEYILSQPAVFFGGTPRGKEAVRDLTLTIPPGRNYRVLGAESTDQWVLVSVEPVPGSGERRFRIVATQKRDAPEGYHFGTIVVRTTSSRNPEIKITVRGVVSAPERRP
jgi:hypothetical protein